MVGIYKKIYAVIFILMLFGFAVADYILAGNMIYSEVTPVIPTDINTLTVDGINSIPGQIDTILTNDLFGKHFWNEAYGTVFAALGKNEENNFAYMRDKQGSLYYGNFWNTSDMEPKEMAKRVRRMQDDLARNGTKVIMLIYPTKFDPSWTEGYYGLPYPDLNDVADELLVYLRRYNIDYIDYRDIIKNMGQSGKELFYTEDSHWREETAFYVTTKLVEHLKEIGEDRIDPDGFYCNPDNYITESYDKYFLGSQGREAGEVYAGRDSFRFITPGFDTYLEWTYTSGESGKKITYKGDFEKTLVQKVYMEKEDLYERDMYSCYMGGVKLRDEILNKGAQNDVDVLFLRNSYSTPVVSFLAPMVRQTDAVWTAKATEENIEHILKSKQYDYVFVALNVDALLDEELSFYTEPLEGQASEGTGE